MIARPFLRRIISPSVLCSRLSKSHLVKLQMVSPLICSLPDAMTFSTLDKTRQFTAEEYVDLDEETTFENVVYPPATATIGSEAPLFKAPAVIDGEITDFSLADYKGKWVVLVFYPKDFTFVCPTELIAFSDRIDEFKKLNAEVIGISTDTENSHLAWTRVPRNQGGLGIMRIPLVADVKKTIASRYGTISENDGIAFRGLFIIDKQGILQQMTINNFPVGRSVDETLRLIQAFQIVAKHGEVCPANWKPGSDTIIPDPEDSQAYFSRVKESHTGKSRLKEIKTAQQLEKTIKGNEKVVVEFMASWCGKCAQIAPFVNELATKHNDKTFVKVDTSVSELGELKESHNVSALPTFLFFKNGKPTGDRVVGYKKNLLADQVEKL